MGVYEVYHVDCDRCDAKLPGRFGLGSRAENTALAAGWKYARGEREFTRDLLCPACVAKCDPDELKPWPWPEGDLFRKRGSRRAAP
jgi:hypothetical protein